MSAKLKDMGSSLNLDQIFCACTFGFVRLFFRKGSPKGPLFNFFDILQQNGRSKKFQRVPLFAFFGTMRLTGDF